MKEYTKATIVGDYLVWTNDTDTPKMMDIRYLDEIEHPKIKSIKSVKFHQEITPDDVKDETLKTVIRWSKKKNK